VIDLGLTLPALVDTPDDRVDRAYMGWPDRLYVIDVDGRIAYKSAPGPFGFETSEVRDALVRLIGGGPIPKPARS
jgi:type I thyroxine 5'-deiodinase